MSLPPYNNQSNNTLILACVAFISKMCKMTLKVNLLLTVVSYLSCPTQYNAQNYMVLTSFLSTLLHTYFIQYQTLAIQYTYTFVQYVLDFVQLS